MDRCCLLVSGKCSHMNMHLTIFHSSRELQLKRLVERDNITLTAAQDRVASQMAIADKVAYADKVLDNSAGVVELERQVSELATSLRAKAGWSWRLNWIFPPLGLVFAAWSLGSRAIYRTVGSKKA